MLLIGEEKSYIFLIFIIILEKYPLQIFHHGFPESFMEACLSFDNCLEVHLQVLYVLAQLISKIYQFLHMCSAV